MSLGKMIYIIENVEKNDEIRETKCLQNIYNEKNVIQMKSLKALLLLEPMARIELATY